MVKTGYIGPLKIAQAACQASQAAARRPARRPSLAGRPRQLNRGPISRRLGFQKNPNRPGSSAAAARELSWPPPGSEDLLAAAHAWGYTAPAPSASWRACLASLAATPAPRGHPASAPGAREPKLGRGGHTERATGDRAKRLWRARPCREADPAARSRPSTPSAPRPVGAGEGPRASDEAGPRHPAEDTPAQGASSPVC
jgi:hypothetical protein